MNKKQKMNKDIVPEDFNLSLAIFDGLPVALFAGNMVLVGRLFSSTLFSFGGILVLFAGLCKVLWKVIVVIKKKNIYWMFLQMRILMPIGLIIMLLSVILKNNAIDFSSIWQLIKSLPICIFFIFGSLAMIMMIIFAFSLDSSNLKANWLEQITNALAQLSFFIGLLLIVNNM